MINYTIQVTLKTFHGSFGSSVERCEFSFCAESRDEAVTLASANVKSQGFPFDQKSVEVVDAIPMTTAMVLYNPRFKFGWGYVADCAEQALMNQCASLARQTEATVASVRKATQVVSDLTRVLAA